MSTALDYLIRVEDHGVDAAVVRRPGQRPVLVLRPGVSFGAAVRALVAVAPEMSMDEAHRIVRSHLPGSLDLDEMLENELALSALSAPSTAASQRPPMRGLFAILSLIAIGVMASIVLAHYAVLSAELGDIREDIAQMNARDAAASHMQAGAQESPGTHTRVGGEHARSRAHSHAQHRAHRHGTPARAARAALADAAPALDEVRALY